MLRAIQTFYIQHKQVVISNDEGNTVDSACPTILGNFSTYWWQFVATALLNSAVDWLAKWRQSPSLALAHLVTQYSYACGGEGLCWHVCGEGCEIELLACIVLILIACGLNKISMCQCLSETQ